MPFRLLNVDMKTMKIKSNTIAAIISILTANACASSQPYAVQGPEQVRISEKSYRLAAVDSAFAGATILRVRDYFITRSEQPYMSASESFAWGRKCSAPKGQSLRILGMRGFEGTDYYVIAVPCGSVDGQMLVSKSGEPTELEVVRGLTNLTVRKTGITPEPSTVRFARVVDQAVDKTRPYANYELLYSGTDGQSFGVDYREFSAEDLARPAFFQSLRYPNSSETIRFRDTTIRVHRVTSEKLVFAVLSDGM
jgi:hypothetical protein